MRGGNGKPKSTRQSVYDCLVENGPLTLAQIVGHTKRHKSNVHNELGNLLRDRKVYMARDKWHIQDGTPQFPRVPLIGPPIVEGLWT